MANRNRTAGHAYERQIVNRFNECVFKGKDGEEIPLFPKLGTTRSLSVYMDSLKIDLTTVDPRELGDFGLLIQAKNSTTTIPYPKLLKFLDKAAKTYGGVPIVYHKQTQRMETKAAKPRFMERGEYISMNATDFEKMFIRNKVLESVYEEFLKYFDTMPVETQKKLNSFLKERKL